MNHIKRGFTSITRRPGKSIILLFLVFILGTVIAGALAVDGAITNTDANLRRNMRPLITFEFDWEGFSQVADEEDIFAGRVTPLPVETIRQIGNLSYVNDFNYFHHTPVISFELYNYHIPHFAGGDGWSTEWAGFSLTGSSQPELMDVREGTIELIDGRMFTEAEITTGAPVAVIFRGLAEANNLGIGSNLPVSSTVFTLEYGSWSAPTAEDIFATKDLELEIIGIFDINRRDIEQLTDFDAHQEWNRIQMLAGRIYSPNQLAMETHAFYTEQRRLMVEANDLPAWFLANEHLRAFILLDDPFDLEAFRASAEPFLPDFWTLLDLTDTFDAISTSMTTLQDIAAMILWMAILGSLTVLSLLILLFLRDRRYEVGVYLALGEKKVKIIIQIVLEVVTTAFIGIALAMFTGNMISNQLSRNMLQTELTTLTEPTDWGAAMFADGSDLRARWGGLGVEELSLDEMMEAFDVSLDLETTLIFYGIGILVVTLSTILPVLYITRLNPKKVLMEAKS